MPSINIPFPGLYDSWLSAELDYTEEQEAEYRAEEDEEGERAFPEPLRLSVSDLAELQFDCMDYSAAYLYLAKTYTEAFDYWAGEALGFTRMEWRYSWADKRKTRVKVDRLGLIFEEMTSPREYNFTTDRIFCQVSGRVVKALFRVSKAEGHSRLEACIKERFTSRSGFISHYSNRLSDWLSKPLADWDENELGTLLRALLPEDDDSLMWATLEGETGYNALSKGMDWAKLDAAKLEKRAELLRDWLDSDAERALIWKASNLDTFRAIVAAAPELFPDAEEDGGFYRCPHTSDMFAEIAP